MKSLGVLTALFLLASCADEKAVNAAFFQNQVSWFRFDAGQENGVLPLKSFEETSTAVWKPYPRASFASDLLSWGSAQGAAAVSQIGLLVLDDSSGVLKLTRPVSAVSIPRTGSLFLWQDKVFFHLFQEPDFGPVSPSLTLAWWAPLQARVAFYPVPNQALHPEWQAISVDSSGSQASPPFVIIKWKIPQGSVFAWGFSRFFLENGKEEPLTPEEQNAVHKPGDFPQEFNSVRERLASRLGDSPAALVDLRLPSRATFQALWKGKQGSLPVFGSLGQDKVILLSQNGWASIGYADRSDARLYRLPELGAAGKYTAVLVLKYGFVVAWETSYRGYGGPAGLVYVPFGVLAP